MGVDHRRHRIGCVMEAIHELEAERNEQGDEQQDLGHVGRDLRAGRIDVLV